MNLNLLNAKTLAERFQSAFIEDQRWKLYFEGLGNTLIISALALVIGVVLGFIIAIVNYTNKKTGKMSILSWLITHSSAIQTRLIGLKVVSRFC